MKRANPAAILAVLGLSFCGACPALASSITLPAISQGWINSTGVASDSVGATNYFFVGNCAYYDCEDMGGEYRNFFQFSVPTLTEPIVSAQLVLNTFNTGFDQSSPSLTYQVTSLPAGFGFDDLGEGVLYGARTYEAGDLWVTHAIDLSPEALQGILAAEGGTFRLGGRVVSGAAFGLDQNDQFIFGAGHSAQQLIITTSDAPPVPEPASILLLAPGVAVLAFRRRQGRGVR